MQSNLSTRLEMTSFSNPVPAGSGAIPQVLRLVAPLLACSIVGTVHAQQVFEGGAGDGSSFIDDGNWLGGYPFPGNDFGGDSVDFTFVPDPPTSPFNILVGVDVVNLGDFTNTQDNVDVVFDLDGGTGSFSFVDTAEIDPGTGGSFTFNLDVTALGSMTFDLLGGGSIAFNAGFTTTAGTILADGGTVTFGSGSTVTSASGTSWDVDNNGGFTFNGSFDATDSQTFNGLDADIAQNRFTFDSATFNATAGGQVARFNAVTASFGDTVTVSVDDPTFDYTFQFDTEAKVTFENLTSDAKSLIFDLVDADSKLSIGGEVNVADASTIAVVGNGMLDFTEASSITVLEELNIDTRGAGDSTVYFQGRMALGAGVEAATITVFTDGTDDTVRFYGDAIRDLDAKIVAEANSSFTLYDFNSGNQSIISAELKSGSTMLLDVPDGAGGGNLGADFLLSSLDAGADANTSIVYKNTSADELDVNLFIRGGSYGGTISQDNSDQDGDLTVGWTQDESTLVGVAVGGGGRQVDIKGRYQARNLGTHTVGVVGGDTATITASGLDVIQGTMIVENGEILLEKDAGDDDRPGNITLSSGPQSAASLIFRNGSSLVAEGELDLGVDSTWTLEDNASATIQEAGTIAGTLNASDASVLAFSKELTVSGSGSMILEDNAAATITEAGVVAGTLTASDESEITFSDKLTVNRGGSVVLEGGAGTGIGGSTLNAKSLILESGSTFEIRDLGDGGGRATLNITDGDLAVLSGSTFIGDGIVEITEGGTAGELSFAGTVIAGALADDAGSVTTDGRLTISKGDLTSQGGTLVFGVSSTNLDNSIIEVTDGEADFRNAPKIELRVAGIDYIPSDVEFTILTASKGIRTGANGLAIQQRDSISRWWDDPTNPAITANSLAIESGSDYTLRNAEYQSEYTLSSELLPTAEFLNETVRPMANADPTSAAGQLLGTLDQYDTLAQYEANLLSTQPTAQVAAIQMPIFSQYHSVLRAELQKKSALVEQRTRAPFRLADPVELVTNQAEVAERTIRQRTRAQTDARGFGVFWGGELSTPTKGIIEGANGDEWGGLGGLEWQFGDAVSAGFNLGYSAFNGTVNNEFGDLRVGTLRLGGFATWTHENFFMDVGLTAGWNHFDVTRNVFSQSPGLGSEQLTSKSDGFLVEGTVGLGYRIPLGESFALTPEGSFLYNYITTGDMDETGSSAASLKVDPGDINAFTGRVGADLSWSALPGLVFDVSAGWQGTFIQNDGYNATLTNLAVPFPVQVENETINSAYYGAGVNYDAAWNVSLDLRYEGRNGDGLDSNMFIGGVSISF